MSEFLLSPQAEQLRQARIQTYDVMIAGGGFASMVLAAAVTALSNDLTPASADDPDLLTELSALQRQLDQLTALQQQYVTERDALKQEKG